MSNRHPHLSWGRYADHSLPLVAGFLLGLVGAWGISQLQFDPSSEIERARALGIVSVSILEGHSKTRDLVTFLATLGLPVVAAVGLWLLRNGRRLSELRASYVSVPRETFRDRTWHLTLLATAGLLLLASFNLSLLYRASWNPFVGSWIFLGEEGENLAWANSILGGGVYGKDFFCLYGPLLVYPLAWAMELFGPTALVQRVLKYVFDLAAYGVVLALLYRTCRWRSSFVLYTAAIFALFPPFLTNSINFTYLRVGLGLAALLLLHVYQEMRTWPWLALTGVLLGLALLFSQEVGVAACVATGAGLLLDAHTRRELGLFLRRTACVAAGALAVILPTLVTLAARGALGHFFDSIFGFPKLTMLGYGAIQAPALADFVRQPLGEGLYYYGIILLYAVVFAYVLPRLVLGDGHRDTILLATLATLGSILFMVAVRRYSIENITKVWLPAVLLLLLLVARSLHEALRLRGPARLGPIALVLGLLGAGAAIFVATDALPYTVNFARRVAFSGKWSLPEHGVPVHDHRAGGIHFDPDSAAAVRSIGDFLGRHTEPGEPVYFFPNEAAYYFLFDRPNPTRYAMSYFAVTTAQRLELIDQLEQAKPRFVVFSEETWRVDRIPETVQVPEVVRYLKQHYRVTMSVEGVSILERLP